MAYEFSQIPAGTADGSKVAVDTVTVGADDLEIQIFKQDLGGDGATVPWTAGRKADALSAPVALSDEDVAILSAIGVSLAALDNAVAGNELQVDIVGAIPAGTNNIGDVDVLTVPTDPFGANADAASATGSISAKLRTIATNVSTAAKQPALGTAGTASTDVLSVQGIAAMTPFLVTASAGTNLNTSALALESGGNLAAIATSLAALDNAVAGNEFQVDLVGSVPAGSNTIGAVTNTALTNYGAGEYETVAASQTGQVLGGSGATGDFLSHLLVVPASVSPGNVIILDNAISITVFPGGTDSVLTLHPFTIDVRAISVSGAWKVTTGANVSVLAVGNFSA